MMKASGGVKVVSTFVGASMLISTGVAVAATLDDAQRGAPVGEGCEQIDPSAASSLVSVANVEGEFSFDQNTVTPNEKIAAMFQKATAALCSSLPSYEISTIEQWCISVSGDVGSEFVATVEELAEESSSTEIKGCVCASNLPGGGAAINAQVTGISLEDIMRKAETNPGVNAVTFVAADGAVSTLPLYYLMQHDAIIAYDINGEDLSASVGGVNQLWISASSGKYFTRDIVEIRFEALEEVPSEPEFATTDTDYSNRPNVSIAMGA